MIAVVGIKRLHLGIKELELVVRESTIVIWVDNISKISISVNAVVFLKIKLVSQSLSIKASSSKVEPRYE